ncbi:hypothetical protein GCM10011487_27950 [Steroidobacter agaridevorans]|uniref:Toxin CptA n=1 Tax=Steroidobacter agaridevorans TaxID=2695856 RepID=A0A829YC51_9GAMM|nr:hypothetical protein [Steroidobacter agaridevorans]GFE80795.1 hypothetical protein GCM10011487_27950 [Steroidobacter agaridevorans]GFE87896.1 hypothetical protein GCM10011488_28500 [Steroidobacter agaridevorans]
MSLPDSAIPTLTLDVRSRRSERRLGALALLGVAAAAMLLPIPPLAAALFFVIAASLVGFGLWWQGWLGGTDRLTAVSWLSDGSWRLASATRQNIPATLSASSRIGSRWLWLRWHIPGAHPRHRSMLILKGDVLPAELRRLNARLRLESVSLCALAGAGR